MLLNILSEGFRQVFLFCCLAFGDVDEDVRDLKDFVQVFLVAVTPVEDFVFVAGDFETLFAFLQANEGDVGEFDLVLGLCVILATVCTLCLTENHSSDLRSE